MATLMSNKFVLFIFLFFNNFADIETEWPLIPNDVNKHNVIELYHQY